MAFVDPTIKHRYVGDDGRVYTASGYAIENSEADYSDYYDKYNKQATQAARDAMYEERAKQNLAYNIGSNWEDIYDFETRSYKPGYSAKDGIGGRLAILAQGGEDIGSRYNREGFGGSSGASGGYSTGNPYTDALYAQQQAAEQRIQAQIDSAVNRLEGQKSDVDQQYNDAARQAYINKMLSQRDMGQQLAASGITGGLSESSRIGLENQYSENLNSLTQNRNNALNEIDMNIAQVRNEGDISLAETQSEYQAMIAQQLLEQQQRQQELAAQLNAQQSQIAASGLDNPSPVGDISALVDRVREDFSLPIAKPRVIGPEITTEAPAQNLPVSGNNWQEHDPNYTSASGKNQLIASILNGGYSDAQIQQVLEQNGITQQDFLSFMDLYGYNQYEGGR